MLTVQMDKIGDLAVVECEGSIARATDAERLRDAVLSQDWARVIMIDLSEVGWQAGQNSNSDSSAARCRPESLHT